MVCQCKQNAPKRLNLGAKSKQKRLFGGPQAKIIL